MEIKVTKRTTNDGVRYSISGLTFDQMFRIKSAMFAEAEKMKAISEEMASVGTPQIQREFVGFAKDARTVAVAVADGI